MLIILRRKISISQQYLAIGSILALYKWLQLSEKNEVGEDSDSEYKRDND